MTFKTFCSGIGLTSTLFCDKTDAIASMRRQRIFLASCLRRGIASSASSWIFLATLLEGIVKIKELPRRVDSGKDILSS